MQEKLNQKLIGSYFVSFVAFFVRINKKIKIKKN